ncbi:MAG: FliM/FliN family flagellar motor switch protein [Acidobacteriota bacterium]
MEESQQNSSAAEPEASSGGPVQNDTGDEAQGRRQGPAPEPADRPAETAGPDRPVPHWNMDLILDVELGVVVLFGEVRMQLKDVLKLGVGSVIELDKGVNDAVSVIVNDKPIAAGEVVMVDGNYGVKLLHVESTADRIRSLA